MASNKCYISLFCDAVLEKNSVLWVCISIFGNFVVIYLLIYLDCILCVCLCVVKENVHVLWVCVCVCSRQLEEPAASGSVRKHLIRNGGMGGWEQRGGDEGGVDGQSVRPTSFSSVSWCTSFLLPCFLSTPPKIPVPHLQLQYVFFSRFLLSSSSVFT